MKKLTYEQILRVRKTPEEALGSKRTPISVVLHNIRSVYNVGSIFRTCDCALVEELILCGFTPHPPRPELEKTALGACDVVPWRYFESAREAAEEQKRLGKKVFAVELIDTSRPYDSLSKNEFPLCLILGNELSGVDQCVIDVCDDAIEIPMLGVKHSLNVAVCAGVAVFEALKIFSNS